MMGKITNIYCNIQLEIKDGPSPERTIILTMKNSHLLKTV